MRMLQGVDPVLRTYNTLIIACNMCGQPREAMAVYRRMLDAGYNPNATTYNALISAYGKNGQLDKVRADSHSVLFACRICAVCLSLSRPQAPGHLLLDYSSEQGARPVMCFRHARAICPAQACCRPG